MNTYLSAVIKKHWGKDLWSAMRNQAGEPIRVLKNRRTIKFFIAKQCFYLKHHQAMSTLTIIKDLLRGGMPVLGAAIEVAALKKLQRIGIAAPEPVAWGVKSGESFIVTRALENDISLEHYVSAWSKKPPTKQHRLALIKAVATLTRIVHSCGINHRDLYLCHYHLNLKSTLHNPKLYLIDLHRAQLRGQIPTALRIKDLAALYSSVLHLNISSKEQYLFLKWYSGIPIKQFSTSDWKFWRKVKIRAKKIWGRNIRKNALPAGALLLPKSGIRPIDEKALATALTKDIRAITLPSSIELCDQFSKKHILSLQQVLSARVPTHAVLRGQWRQEKIIAKIFNLKSAQGSRHWQRCIAGAKLLEQHNIPSPQLLASFATAKKYLGIILFQDLEKSRNATAKDCAEIIALMTKMHQKNLVQKDSHPNNFIWHQKKLYALDSEDISISKSNKVHRYSITKLLTRIIPVHLQADIAHSLKIDKKLLQQVRNRRMQRSVHSFYKNNAQFHVAYDKKKRIIINRDQWPLQQLKLLSNIEDYTPLSVLKDGTRSKVTTLEIQKQKIIVKAYLPSIFCSNLAEILFAKSAWRYWRNVHWLLRYSNVKTPAPIAFIKEHYWLRPCRSWIVTHYQDGATLTELLQKQTNDQARLKIAQQYHFDIWCFFENLKQLKLCHRDTKGSNFILTKNDLHIIDLDGMSQHPYRWPKYRYRDKQRFLKDFQNDPMLYGYCKQLLDHTMPLKK